MKRIIFILFCTILYIPLSYSQQERVTFHIDSDTIHLYTFGVYRDSVPSDTWYYFGEYGQILKTRSDFKVDKSQGLVSYRCLEKTYALHGEIIHQCVVHITDEELRTHFLRAGKHSVHKYQLDEQINQKNKGGKSEGFWRSIDDGRGTYNYLRNGNVVNLSYETYKGSLLWMYVYGDSNELEYFYMPFEDTNGRSLMNVLTNFNTEDYIFASGYDRAYYSNGQLQSEGTIVYEKEEGFFVTSFNSGVWKYYDESGNLIKISTYPIKTIRKDEGKNIDKYSIWDDGPINEQEFILPSSTTNKK